MLYGWAGAGGGVGCGLACAQLGELVEPAQGGRALRGDGDRVQPGRACDSYPAARKAAGSLRTP